MKEWPEISLLIVDDEVDLAELIAFEFEMSGAKVFTASNGEEALDILNKNKNIDVIVSDIRMPKVDGIELLDRVVSNDSLEARVILMTGFSDISIDKAYSKGAVAVFPKPFNRKDLSHAVLKATQNAEGRLVNGVEEQPAEISISETFSSYEEAQKDHLISYGVGGLFYGRIEPQYSVGKVVSLDFKFENDESYDISGVGVVRWVRRDSVDNQHAGCGIEIISLNDITRGHFVKLVDSNASPAYIPLD